MTTPGAIIVGAVIIGLSIVSARVLAPYQISSGTALVWRVNAVSGAVELCNVEVDAQGARGPRCR